MTRSETEMLLAYMEQFYTGGAEISEDMIIAWHDLFREYPAETVFTAGKEAVRSWQGSKIPPPGKVMQFIKTDDAPVELWNEAMKLIRKGTVLTKEQFDEAPEEVRTYFGSIQSVREVALMDLGQLGNEKARFLKAVPVLSQRIEARKKALPTQNIFAEIEHKA